MPHLTPERGTRRRLCSLVTIGLAAGALALSTVPRASAAPLDEAGAAPAPSAVSIPVLVHHAPTGDTMHIVEIRINGSDPLRMMLDTGSSGLVTFPGALDTADPQPTDTGIPVTADYTGSSVTGTLVTGTVSIGGHATPDAIPFVDGTACSPECMGASAGADLDGIFGIGQGAATHTAGDGTVYQTYSVLSQLGGDLAAGHTLALTDDGGTLTLGKPVEQGEHLTLLDTRATGGSYSNGQPIFDKLVDLCWHIGEAVGCGRTVFDTGVPDSNVMGDQFLPWVTLLEHPIVLPGVPITLEGWVNDGTPIGLSLRAEGSPFVSWEVGPTPHKAGYYTAAPGDPPFFNTGSAIFTGRTVGYDNETGRMIIGGTDPAGPGSGGDPSGPYGGGTDAGAPADQLAETGADASVSYLTMAALAAAGLGLGLAAIRVRRARPGS